MRFFGRFAALAVLFCALILLSGYFASQLLLDYDAERFFDIAAWFISTESTITMSLAVLLAGLCFALAFCRSAQKAAQDVFRALEDLKQTPSLGEFIDAALDGDSKKPRLSKAFLRLLKRYAANLKKADELSELAPAAGSAVFISTAASEDFFNEETLFRSRLNIGFFESVPGLLTGLGIFFTFVGLASGVTLATNGLLPLSTEAGQAELNAGSIAEMIRSIGSLLNGAGQAFFTSIAGLFGSIFFASLLYKSERRVQSAIDDFNSLLEDQAPVVSMEVMQFALCRRAASQEKTVSEILPAMQRTIEACNEKLITDLADLINKIVSANNEALLKALSEAIDKLDASVRELTAKLGVQIGDELARAVDSLRDGLKQALSDMTASFAESAKSVSQSVEALDAVLKTMKTEIEEAGSTATAQVKAIGEQCVERQNEAAAQFKASSASAQEKLEAFSDELLHALDAVKASFAGITKEADDKLRAFESAMEEAFARTQAALAAAGDEAADSIRTLNGQVADVHQTILQGSEQIKDNVILAGKVTDDAVSKIDKAFKDFSGLNVDFTTLAKQIESAGASIKDAIEKIKDVVPSIQAIADAIKEAGLHTIQQFGEALKQCTEANQEAAKNLNLIASRLSDISESQAGVQENAKRLQDLLTNAVQALAVAVQKIQQALEDNLREADSGLSKAVYAMNDALSAVVSERKSATSEFQDAKKFFAAAAQFAKTWPQIKEAMDDLTDALDGLSDDLRAQKRKPAAALPPEAKQEA